MGQVIYLTRRGSDPGVYSIIDLSLVGFLLREHGVLLAEGDSSAIRQVPVPVVERPSGRYDLTAVLVRTHQVDAVLESIAGLDDDVLFLLKWAAGPEPLGAAIGRERVLLGFPRRPAPWTGWWSATGRPRC